MSRIIKQNIVALSEQKKMIENIGTFQAIEPRILEREETAAVRVVQGIAESLLQEQYDEQEQMEVMETESRSFDFSSYEEEAQKIIDDANAGKAKIYEDAYNLGMEKAKEELARRTAILEEEYQTKKDTLEKDLQQEFEENYQKEIHQLEGKMILWMSEMLEKLVGQASQNKNVLTHLIRMGMQEISLQGDLIIRVSEQDLDFVLQNKGKLTEELSEKLTIEVLKDKSLQKNQCIIETIMGNIECSLDVQLKGIRDELRLIYESIMKNVNA